jgi:hypothetical protein
VYFLLLLLSLPTLNPRASIIGRLDPVQGNGFCCDLYTILLEKPGKHTKVPVQGLQNLGVRFLLTSTELNHSPEKEGNYKVVLCQYTNKCCLDDLTEFGNY